MSDFFANAKVIPPAFKNQRETTKFLLENPRVFDMSEPGTGKTRGALDEIKERRSKGGGKTLVLAPKSILKPAWGNDIEKFTPELTYSIANASNRAKAFNVEADVYITNHDAVNWLIENPSVLKGFDNIKIDESTAFKHRTAGRSKALRKLIKQFEFRELMTGTPNPNGLTDLFHQALLLDDGERLGKDYFRFRNAVQEPIQTGPRPEYVTWQDKEDAELAIAELLSDISLRYLLSECHDIPANHTWAMNFDLSPKHMAFYKQMEKDQQIEVNDTIVTAVHAASLANKLIQIASGAVYDEDHISQLISSDRYNIIIDLVEARSASIVAFLWKHQRDNLIKLAKQKKIEYAVIDGDSTPARNDAIVKDFQAGNLQTIFAHPKSAGHGLTLTRGVATIWASPTINAEWWEQFNRRIYRATQTQPTETIVLVANGTKDEPAFERLRHKVIRQDTLLAMVYSSSAA